MRFQIDLWKNIFTKLGIVPTKRNKLVRRHRFSRRLRMEGLEDRQMLTTFTVNTPVDEFNFTGNTSLREAIFAAESDDTIDFDVSTMNGATITLDQTKDHIVIDGKSLTIDASMLTNGITIDADDPDDDLPPEEQERGNGIRIFKITDPTAGSSLVTLKGLTLKGGDPSDSSENGNGGAIFSTSRLMIFDCTIEENDAYSGGGIHIKVAGDSPTVERQILTIEDSVIQNNEARSGGGIDIDSSDTTDPTSDLFSITRTTISNNRALSQDPRFGGGGLYAELHGAHLTVTESTISGNTAAALTGDYYGGGGGLYAALHNSASLTVDKTVVSDNHATSGNGGGILATALYVSEPDPNQRAITITRSTISENTADDRGGGLFLFNREGTEVLVHESRVTGNAVPSDANGGYLNGGGIYAFFRNLYDTETKPKWTITGSTVDNNITPEKGGGIFVRSNFNGNFIATNSTISDNESGGAGGGMYLSHNQSVDAWLRNLTITQNVSATGGGVAIVDDDNTRVRIANSIISENFSDAEKTTPNNLDGRVYITQSPTLNLDEFTHNLIGGGSMVLDLDGAEVVSTTWDNANISSDTPLLDELADNGGPTPTHRLRYEPIENIISPAIDAGSDDRATVPLTGDPADQNDDDPLSTDQRGADFERSVNLAGVFHDGKGPVDIGAYEVDSAFICVTTTDDELDTNLGAGDLSLREAVKYAIHTAPDPTTICLPAGDYNLMLNGADEEHGDLDIVGGVHSKVTIVGDGPGLSVINAGTLTTKDRVFDVFSGKVLDLSGVTLKLGDTPNGSQANGGAIRVQGAPGVVGRLDLSYSAIVGNDTGSSGTGGAIYFGSNTTGAIEASVITVNTADEQTGGIYLEAGYGTVTIKSTIVANNNLGETDPDIYAGSSGRLQSLGYNRFTSYGGFTLHGTDEVGAVNYVVTSVADTYDGLSDAKNMSLRDAIHQANITAGTQEIWLPAWDFALTRQRTTAANQVEMNVSEGDLEIDQSTIIRGIAGSTSVGWAPGLAADKVFELVGDYNGNRAVDGADYVLWQDEENQPGSNLPADGNDDGDVNSLDYYIQQAHFGNTLLLDGVVVT